jgi:hypothetical protein
MSSIGRPVLNAGAASMVGDVIECSGIAHLQLFVKVTTAVALTGSFAIATTPDGTGDLETAAAAPPILVSGNLAEVTARPASFGSLGTDATFTLTAVPIGTTLYAVRLINPPQYVVPRFVYGSGGDATTKFQIFAYGFSIKT